MRIAIDCRWIFPKISGIGKYTENLVRGLSEIDHHNHYLFLKDPLVPYTLFSLANQIRFPRLLKRLDVDIYHSANFMIPLFIPRNIKVVITIHDLIPLKFPQYTPKAKKTRFRCFYKWIMKKVVSRADVIIADSDNTAKDLLDCLGVPLEKIKVVYIGIDPEFCSNKVYKQDSYILFVGRPEPYKNLITLVKAYAKLLKDYGVSNKLMIVGESDPRYPEIFRIVEELDLKNKIIFHGYAEFKELVKLYQNASLFVLPSLYEGFGLPPLEAMACGVPVIVSNTPALVETVADKAIVVDPYDTEWLTRAIHRVLTDKPLRDKMSQEGLEHAKKFTIDSMARETLHVYESCFKNKSGRI